MSFDFLKVLRLVKLRHAVFGLPFTIASTLVAAQGLPSVRIMLLVICGFLCARSLGMSLNRLFDRHIDAKNPRTAHRLMATGEVTVKTLIPYMIFFSLGLAYCAWSLNETTLGLLPVCFLILLMYPLAKRFTYLSHVLLGVVLAMGPIGAWAAIRDSIDAFPVFLGVGIVLWVSGFDIIYALQDEDFDRQEGLFSIPAIFGYKKSLLIAGIAHILVPLLWLMAGLKASMGTIYFSGILLIGLILLIEHFFAWKRTPKSIGFAFFQLNTYVSLGFLMITCLEVFI